MKIDRKKLSTKFIFPDIEKRLLNVFLSHKNDAKEFASILSRSPGYPFDDHCDMVHWADLWDTCDEFLEKEESDSSGDDEYLLDVVYPILLFSATWLENSVNRHCYNSVDRILRLLTSKEDSIAELALKCLHAIAAPILHMRNTSSTTWHLRNAIRKQPKLVSQLCQLSSGPAKMIDLLSDTHRIPQFIEYSYTEESVPKTIKIPVTKNPSSDECFLKLVAEHEIKNEFHFSIRSQVRFANLLASSDGRQKIVETQLIALRTLVYLFPDSDDVFKYFAEYPDLSNDIVDLIRPVNSERVPIDIKRRAMMLISALVAEFGSDGSRSPSVTSALGIERGMSQGVLPSVFRSAISELAKLSEGKLMRAASETDLDLGLGVAFVEATARSSLTDSQILEQPAFLNLDDPLDAKLHWIELVLQVVKTVLNVQNGTSLMDCGLVPSMTSAIKADIMSPLHGSVVSQCLIVLETSIVSSTEAANLFRDLNGADVIVKKLADEVERASEKREEALPMMISTGQRSFLYALIGTLSVVFNTQGAVTSNSTANQLQVGPLTSALKSIFENVSVFEGSVFGAASTLLSDIINSEPSSVNHVHASGLATVYLTALNGGNLPPVSELLMAIPSVLNALSLNSDGADKVISQNPFRACFKIFVSPRYVKSNHVDCLLGDIPAIIGSGLNELIRNVPASREIVIEAAVQAVKDVHAYHSENQEEESTKTLFTFVDRLSQALEPLLSKPDNGLAFAKDGGVDSLLGLFPLLMPSTESYLETIKTESEEKLPHFAATNSLSMAVRAFGTQQPNILLNRLLRELDSQLDLLEKSRSAIGICKTTTSLCCKESAVGILNAAIVNSKSLATLIECKDVKLTQVASYFKILSMVHLLMTVLSSLTKSVQHSQSQPKKWFPDFVSSTCLGLVKRLFALDRSILWECAQVTSDLEQEKANDSEGALKDDDVRTLGLSMLSKYHPSARELLQYMIRGCFRSSRRSSSSSHPAYYSALVDAIDDVLKRDIEYGKSQEGDSLAHSKLLCAYYNSILSSVAKILREERSHGVNVLVQVELFKKGTTELFIDAAAWIMKYCIDAGKDSFKNHLAASFSTACKTLQHYCNVQAIVSSDRFPKDLKAKDFVEKLHLKCATYILPILESPNLSDLPIDNGLMKLLPIAIQIVADRQDKKPAEGSSNNSNGRDFFVAEDEDNAEVEAAIEQLVLMGFPRPRVETALRHVGVQSLEVAMDWMLNNPEAEGDGSESKKEEEGVVSSSVEVSSEEDLYPKYDLLQEIIPSVCIKLVTEKSTSDESKMSCRALTLLVYQYFIGVSKRSLEDSKKLMEMICSNLRTDAGDDNLLQVLVLWLNADAKARMVFTEDHQETITSLLSRLNAFDGGKDQATFVASVLLVFDSLMKVKSPSKYSKMQGNMEETLSHLFSTDESKTAVLSSKQSTMLLNAVLNLLKKEEITSDAGVVSAACLVLSRILREYNQVAGFMEKGGLSIVLNLPVYEQGPLVAIICRRLLEDEDTLLGKMTQALRLHMKLLVQRYGSPEQMRISPRIFFTPIMNVMYRNPMIFAKALKSSVSIKRSVSRTYVVLNDNKETRSSIGKRLGSHVYAQQVVSTLVELYLEKRSDSKCGAYLLEILLDLVSYFTTCALALHRYVPKCNTLSSAMVEKCSPFTHFLLDRVLPSPLQMYPKDSKALSQKNDSTKKTTTIVFRLQESTVAQKFVMALCSHPGEGTKRVLRDLARLISSWSISELAVDAVSEFVTDDDSTSLWKNPVVSLWRLQSFVSLVSSLLLVSRSELVMQNVSVFLSESLPSSLLKALGSINITTPETAVLVSNILKPLEFLYRPSVLDRHERLLKAKKVKENKNPLCESSTQEEVEENDDQHHLMNASVENIDDMEEDDDSSDESSSSPESDEEEDEEDDDDEDDDEDDDDDDHLMNGDDIEIEIEEGDEEEEVDSEVEDEEEVEGFVRELLSSNRPFGGRNRRNRNNDHDPFRMITEDNDDMNMLMGLQNQSMSANNMLDRLLRNHGLDSGGRDNVDEEDSGFQILESFRDSIAAGFSGRSSRSRNINNSSNHQSLSDLVGSNGASSAQTLENDVEEASRIFSSSSRNGADSGGGGTNGGTFSTSFRDQLISLNPLSRADGRVSVRTPTARSSTTGTAAHPLLSSHLSTFAEESSPSMLLEQPRLIRDTDLHRLQPEGIVTIDAPRAMRFDTVPGGGGLNFPQLRRSTGASSSARPSNWTDDGQIGSQPDESLGSCNLEQFFVDSLLHEETKDNNESKDNETKDNESKDDTTTTTEDTGVRAELSDAFEQALVVDTANAATSETAAVASTDDTEAAASTEVPPTAAGLPPPAPTTAESLAQSLQESMSVLSTSSSLSSSNTTAADGQSSGMMNFTLDLPAATISATDNTSTDEPPPATTETETTETSEVGNDEAAETSEVGEEEEKKEEDNDDNNACPEGMDPEVFAMLPEDMRQEVLEAHRAETALSSGESNIDPETLSALPEDIRREVLAQERREREQANAAASSSSNAAAAEMDNASFVASLAPELRDEILMTSDATFLSTLPSALQAEAQLLRERASSNNNFGFFAPSRRGRNNNSSASRNERNAREAERRRLAKAEEEAHLGQVQMELDRDLSKSVPDITSEGIVALCSLMYLRYFGRKFKRLITLVMQNLAANPKTRHQVLSNVFQILNEALSSPAPELLKKFPKTLFGPSMMDGCNETIVYDDDNAVVSTSTSAARVPVKVMRRLLELLSQFCTNIPRCKLYLLGKSQVEGSIDNPNYLSGLINLLGCTVFANNASDLELLAELLEKVVAPLSKIPKEKQSIEESKEESKEEESKEESKEVESKEESKEVESKEESKEEKKEWVTVPRPILGRKELKTLIGTLLYDTCTEVTCARVTNVILNLGRISENLQVMLLELVEAAQSLSSISLEKVSQVHQSFVDNTSDSGLLITTLYEVKLLRVLQTVSSALSPAEFTQTFCAKLDLSHLWEMLSKCLAKATAKEGLSETSALAGSSSSSVAAVLARFLPLIKAFFVVNNETSSSTNLVNFVERNRVLLNSLVRENSKLLDTSLNALVNHQRCRMHLDFDNKRTFFKNQMKKLRQEAHRRYGSIRLQVRRSQVFEDSFNSLRMRTSDEMRGKLHVTFHREEGIDAGGLTREWYVILAREIFNPNYALFTAAADSPSTFQPNPLSSVNKDHLSYFKFVGRIIGKAICDGQLLDAHFTRSFYKHLLQISISYHDIEAIDPEYYRSLRSMLEHSLEDLGLDDSLSFSVDSLNFGKVECEDLKPNGRNITVTDCNKMEYVKLVAHHRMTTGIQSQLNAFLEGFHELVSSDLVSIFNENELELLISGMPEIDIDDLKANTNYNNYKASDVTIQWFWKALYSFSHEERALFVQFVTGTSKVPLEGFVGLEGMRGRQKFNIHKSFTTSTSLPTAHTCFNQLDLPSSYDTEEVLKDRLLFAIKEGSEGFGFG